MRDDEDRTTGGRLFQARGAATGNDRSPKVDLLTGGTMRDVGTYTPLYPLGTPLLAGTTEICRLQTVLFVAWSDAFPVSV